MSWKTGQQREENLYQVPVHHRPEAASAAAVRQAEASAVSEAVIKAAETIAEATPLEAEAAAAAVSEAAVS